MPYAAALLSLTKIRERAIESIGPGERTTKSFDLKGHSMSGPFYLGRGGQMADDLYRHRVYDLNATIFILRKASIGQSDSDSPG